MMHLVDNAMNTDTTHISPEVIAFDFYDGATEGIASSVKECGRCYFKLIAWDQGQDKRLYAVTKIDVSKYDQLFTLLTGSQEPPSLLVWIPEWKFRDKKDEQEANNLIDSFQIDMCSSKLLVFGKDISDDSIRIIRIDNQVMGKVKKILRLGKPDDLSNWMPMLG